MKRQIQTNSVRCGYLDNIVYDYTNGKLPVDKVLDNDLGLFDGLTWSEESKIRKYYSLAVKQGANSIYHLKLAYVVQDIIKKYLNGARWYNRFCTNAFTKLQ